MTPERDSDTRGKIAAGFQMISIVLASIMFSALFLTVLPHLGIIDIPPENHDPYSPLRHVFLVLAVVLAIAGFSLKKALFRVPKKAEGKDHVTNCLKALHISHIVSFAVFEAIAVLGFVLFMITGDAGMGLIFGGLSAACMILAWPRAGDFREKIGSVL